MKHKESLYNDTFLLSRRGWLVLAVVGTLLLFFGMTGLHMFQFLFGALFIALLMIYRNPERNSSINEENSIVSVMDGVVMSVEETVIDEQAMTKVTVLNGLWDVSMLRFPFDGKAGGYRIRRGASLPLYHPLAAELNEKAVLSFENGNGNQIYLEHLSEKSCFPIQIDLDEGTRIKEGTRYGFMAKGRSTMYIPSSVKVTVNVGSHLKAGETLIGNFETL